MTRFHLLLLLSSLAAPSLLTSQTALTPWTETTPGTWIPGAPSTELELDLHASLASSTVRPGEIMVVLAHVTTEGVDPDQLGKTVADIYPAFETDGWTVGDLEAAAFEIASSKTMELAIPPDQARAYLASIVGAPAAGCGVDASNPSWRGPDSWTGSVPSNLPDDDFRRPWIGVWPAGTAHPEVFDVLETGRLAAQRQVEAMLVDPDPDQFQALYELLKQEIGFYIRLQVFFLEPSTGGGDLPDVRVEPPVAIFTRTLGSTNTWHGTYGALRYLPDLLNPGRFLYLAYFGEELHVLFDDDVGNSANYSQVQAWIQTPNGYVSRPLLPSSVSPLVTLPALPLAIDGNAYAARFAYPWDGLPGPVYFTALVAGSTQQLVPLFADGAHAATVFPSMLPAPPAGN